MILYLGIVGLNNIKANDYMNVVLQVRIHSLCILHKCHVTIMWLSCDHHVTAGSDSCVSLPELLFGWSFLFKHQVTTWRSEFCSSPKVGRTLSQVVEPSELQVSRLPSRDAAGRVYCKQKEVQDNGTRWPCGLSDLATEHIAPLSQRRKKACNEFDCRNISRTNECFHT